MTDSTGKNGKGSNKKIIAALEREKDELATENAKKNEEIKKMKIEMEKLRKDSDSTIELEKETARLRKELVESKAETEKLRKILEEKESKIEVIEKEGKELKQENVEMEMKVREMERKIGVIEMKEVEENSKRVRVEEMMKEKVDEKKREVEELESVLIGKKNEVEKWLKENRELEEKIRVLEFSLMNMKDKGLEKNWPVVAAGSAGGIALILVLIRFFIRKKR
jgi:chromosome segregation ATPase